MSARFSIPCITSNHFYVIFLLLYFHLGIKVMHKQLFSAFRHHILPFSPGLFPLIDPATASQLMHEPLFLVFMHQFPDFAPAARIRLGPRLEEKRCTKGFHGLRASLLNIRNSKGIELTTKPCFRAFRRQFSPIPRKQHKLEPRPVCPRPLCASLPGTVFDYGLLPIPILSDYTLPEIPSG